MKRIFCDICNKEIIGDKEKHMSDVLLYGMLKRFENLCKNCREIAEKEFNLLNIEYEDKIKEKILQLKKELK